MLVSVFNVQNGHHVFQHYNTCTHVAGIIGLVFFLVTILIFIFLGSKIRISIAIIKEASRLAFFLSSFQTEMSLLWLHSLYVSCGLLLFQCGLMLGCKWTINSFIHRAVFGIPTSVIYPVFSWALLTVLFMYWAAVALYPSHLTPSHPHSPMTLTTSSSPLTLTIMTASSSRPQQSITLSSQTPV